MESGKTAESGLLFLYFFILYASIFLSMAGINVTEGTAINGLKNISWPHNYDVGSFNLNTLQYVTFQREVFLKPTT